jgi:hypothetical protein
MADDSQREKPVAETSPESRTKELGEIGKDLVWEHIPTIIKES